MTDRPAGRWIRAGGYFVVCWGIAVVVDVFSVMPPSDQPGGVFAFGLFACMVAFVAYWLVWPRGTHTGDRPLVIGPTIVFGLAWGTSEGLLFASIWTGLDRIVEGPALVGGSFLAIAAYNGVWHALVWDRYVAPPHNIPEWDVRKIAIVHAPTLLVALIHLTVYRSVAWFLAIETVALVGSAVFMRFPPPWTVSSAASGSSVET